MANVLLIESGFTTQLETHAKKKIADHPLWGAQCSYTDPEAEIETHRDFIRAGVDVMITNTYQASIEGFMKHLNLSKQESFDLIKESVSNCRKAIELEKKMKTIDENKNILIAGSVGSFGAFLADGSEYTGNYIDQYDINYIKEWHRPRIQALIEGGVDLLAFETIPVLKEAEILVELIKEFPNVKAWISFSGKDHRRIVHGELFEDVVERCWSLNSSQLIAIGINCTDAEIATQLVQPLVRNGVPTIVYPNSGQIWDGINKQWINVNKPDSVGSYVNKWCEMGVKYIGHCCGTTMDILRQMRTLIDEFSRPI